jgi:PAS domain S-box-containing protein
MPGELEEGVLLRVVDGALAPCIVATVAGRLTHANAQACELFGYSLDEMRKLSRDELCDATDVRLGRGVDARRLHGHHTGELTLVKKGGERFEALLASTLFAGAGGEGLLLVSIKDLTPGLRAAAAEERLRAAIDASTDAFYLLAAARDAAGEIFDFRILDVNAAGLALVGAKREEVLGQLLCELWPINRTGGFFDRYKRVVETGVPLEEEFNISAPYVRANWIHQQVVAWAGGIAITTRNVTARRRNADALAFLDRASRALSATFDRDAVLQTAAQLGTQLGESCVVLVGEAVASAHRDPTLAATLAAHPRATGGGDIDRVLAGEPHVLRRDPQAPEALAPPSVGPALDEAALLRALEPRASVLVPIDVGETRRGVVVVGSYDPRYFDQADVATVRQFAERVASAYSNAELHALARREIDERKRSEEALRMREEELTVLADATAEALFIHRGGLILATNAAAKRLYRLPPDGAVGHRLLDYVAPEAVRSVEQRIATRSTEPYESIALRADGTRFPAAVQARSTTFRGEPARLAAIRDLTELKQLQSSLALADRMASVGTLAAGVAHEINNPLAFAMLGIEQVIALLARGAPAPADVAEALQMLRDAEQGAERVRAIVRDLKAFSRGDDETVGPTDLGAVIGYAARVAAAEIRHRAHLSIDLADAPPVVGNDTRLGQVFLNLLVNAAQAIVPGAADRNSISITARRSGEDVVVAVADTGSGIPPEQLAHVFDPFVTTKRHGMGLGLAICHGIVTRLGGSIAVESLVGVGTTFRVTLPIAQRAPAAREADRAATPAPARSRILIVDDEPVLRRVVARALEPLHDVVGVSSGKEALELLARGEQFDAILCDLLMPEMTGMELHARLLEQRPELAARTAFLTGGVFTREAEEFLERSARPWLEKPFTIDAIHQMVARILAKG